mmetsp:Transcript_14165/g.34090  ORF Transcript_14165/g.34090 Transcript_14165/m.34090 type:complete len:109 (-) Transcript_14165:198-524(-)|eukprot:CAMPEP_0197584660 /NCGR_PEP_ID=MMETSP1326-20131121/7204_1 /TAXON_ID=1155430 /ORGANISM="Genus nov. species nov., Strain RCC2288" /LENGTH=108 /DNA_ID=CAMNT_0043149063 /DNA_START=64 /DNA_END=390 /DNA_ORIENTATION=+
MSARTALLSLARRAAAKAPAQQLTRRNMSGHGATVEEEIAEMQKWKGITLLLIPTCAAFGFYCLTKEHPHHDDQPAYSYLRIRNKELPWGGDCGLFEYGKCQEPKEEE